MRPDVNALKTNWLQITLNPNSQRAFRGSLDQIWQSVLGKFFPKSNILYITCYYHFIESISLLIVRNYTALECYFHRKKKHRGTMRHYIMDEDSVPHFTAIHYTFTGGGCTIHVLFNRCSVALSAVQWGTNTVIITKADGMWQVSKIILFPDQLKKEESRSTVYFIISTRNTFFSKDFFFKWQTGSRCLESLEKQNNYKTSA